MSYEDDCLFVGYAECEEMMDSQGLDMAEEEAKFFDNLR